MLNTTKKIVYRFCFGANAATILFLWLSAASTYVSPSTISYAEIAGLLFPFMLIINAAFLAFWVFFKWRTVWLPIMGYIFCAGTIRTYFPINIPSAPPEGSIKVLSYNVMCFANLSDSTPLYSYAARYIKESKADIVCIQEAVVAGEQYYKDFVEPELKDYPYKIKIPTANNQNALGCYSRYPIIKNERIDYESISNGSIAFWINIKGDTVIVVNNHLESNKLSVEDRNKYKQLVKSPEDAPLKSNIKLLSAKVKNAGRTRAYQADSVASYIRKHNKYTMIVCGDFNDSPVSYARKTIASELTDAYRESGNGIGRSFNKDVIYVRIDHMFCSKNLEPYGATVDFYPQGSDHHPIFCFFKKKANSAKS